MKLRRSIIMAMAAVLAACSGETGDQGMAQSAAEMTPEAAIEDIRTQYEQHYNMHHADVVAGLLADSAIYLLADGSVHHGKEAITAALQAEMAASPTLGVTTGETMVFGDHALARGTYTVNLTPEGGTATTVAGNHVTYFTREGDAWKIAGVLTNYSAPPDGSAAPPPPATPMEAPPENGTLGELTSQWAQHYNMGHADVVANLYTENAVVSFADGPVAEGREALTARLAESIAQGQPQITIHDVETIELGNGWVLDSGWYEVTATAEAGPQTRSGAYVVLGQRAEDGSVKIHWHYANSHPVPPAG